MRHRTRIVGMTVVATLALAPASTASAAFPGANGDVAFGRSSQGQVDIWVVFPGVTGTARLTDTPNRNESMPDWNAAGTRLAYSRCAGSKLGKGGTAKVKKAKQALGRKTSRKAVMKRARSSAK